MPKVKISEYSATANSNTDVASINIDEGCAPSGINNAIRAVMGHLKDFQQGTNGDPFNGPVNGTLGATTASTAVVTTLNSTDATDASSTTAAAMKTAGGLGVAKKMFVGLDANIYGLTVGRGAGAVATNTAVGASALAGSNSGTGVNTAVGNSALITNSTGYYNTAIGAKHPANYFSALESNTTGNSNIAVGTAALGSNTTGSFNTALGFAALPLNTTASNNTAVGYQAGYTNSTGTESVFIGYKAGFAATTNGYNTFVGSNAGVAITTGSYNCFIGGYAGANTTTGTNNTFIGANSTTSAAGYLMTTGSKNTIIGNYSGNASGLDIRTASNYIVLSDGDGWVGLHIKNGVGTSLPSVASGAGTNALRYSTATSVVSYDTSSARYKDNIRDSVYGLSHVMQMRSAQFEYKDTGRSDVGLIAEELDPIIPELVGKNKDGEPDSVSYDRMVSVLVKAIQELKAEVDSLKAQINGASA